MGICEETHGFGLTGWIYFSQVSTVNEQNIGAPKMRINFWCYQMVICFLILRLQYKTSLLLPSVQL